MKEKPKQLVKLNNYFAIAMVTCFSLTGCVTPPSKQEIAAMDYGAPLTVDYETVIKSSFQNILKDPMSAQYQFSTPQTFWYKEAPMMGGQTYSGYSVLVKVNAKNGFGGYTGFQPYIFIFKNNHLVKILDKDLIELMKIKTS